MTTIRDTQALNKKKSGWFWWWRMEADVGGLAIGYLFGLHLTTFLFLLFSPPAFLSVSVISSLVFALLATHFKPTIATGVLSTYFHPSPGTKLCFLIHIFLRITTSTTGAFSFLLAVSLLPSPPLPSWQAAYSRFYVSDGSGWLTAQEKGFIAAWLFFAGLGYIEDWALNHWPGQNPDETWDEYLDCPKNGDRARERVRVFVAASPTRPLHSPSSQSHLPMTHQSLTPPLIPPVPSLPASIPATPSLLNIIKRVEVARQQAYTAGVGIGMIHETAPSPSNEKADAAVDGLPAGIKDGDGWDDFWTEVKYKARSP